MPPLHFKFIITCVLYDNDQKSANERIGLHKWSDHIYCKSLLNDKQFEPFYLVV